MEYLDHEVK
jgi:cell division cycle 2-like protein